MLEKANYLSHDYNNCSRVRLLQFMELLEPYIIEILSDVCLYSKHAVEFLI